MTALLYLNTLIIIAGDFICIDWQRTVKLAINIYLPLCCMKTMLFLSDLSFLQSGTDFYSICASVWNAWERVGVIVISEVSGWKRCELHSHQCSVVIFKASVMVVFIFWHIYLTLFVYSVSIWVYDIMWFLSPSITM